MNPGTAEDGIQGGEHDCIRCGRRLVAPQDCFEDGETWLHVLLVHRDDAQDGLPVIKGSYCNRCWRKEVGLKGKEVKISEWQQRSADWMSARFPNDTRMHRGLVLGEEFSEVLLAAVEAAVAAGKVQRCVLKAEQGIRGGTDHWNAELRSEAADAFFTLVALAHRSGFSLADAIDDKWALIEAKTYEVTP